MTWKYIINLSIESKQDTKSNTELKIVEPMGDAKRSKVDGEETEVAETKNDGIDGNIADVFKIAIDNAINHTAHEINYDIINKGAFVGFGGKK